MLLFVESYRALDPRVRLVPNPAGRIPPALNAGLAAAKGRWYVHPAIALPCGRGADGLPRGLQLVGHRGSTERLLAIAATVERQIIGGPGSVGGGAG